jgi:hypothetical protein
MGNVYKLINSAYIKFDIYFMCYSHLLSYKLKHFQRKHKLNYFLFTLIVLLLLYYSCYVR